MDRTIIRVQGALELGGLLLFLLGFFGKMPVVMIVGGSLLVVNDVLAILSGAMNPLSLAILATVLAVLIRPWYVGLFWGLAGLSALNIPNDVVKVVTPERIIEKIARRSAGRPA